MYKAETSRVWLSGKPLEAFVYKDPATQLPINTDASAYRPDPRDVLSLRKKYEAQLVFEPVLIDGKMEDMIRIITVGKHVFAKIR